MSAAVCTVIYGIPLLGVDFYKDIWSDDLSDLVASRAKGFHTPYSGNAPVSPAAFGVELFEFAEGWHHIFISASQFQPTIEQLTKYRTLWEDLDLFVQEEIESKYGSPSVFILFSTS